MAGADEPDGIPEGEPEVPVEVAPQSPEQSSEKAKSEEPQQEEADEIVVVAFENLTQADVQALERRLVGREDQQVFG